MPSEMALKRRKRTTSGWRRTKSRLSAHAVDSWALAI
jgi:hypothetical protein